MHGLGKFEPSPTPRGAFAAMKTPPPATFIDTDASMVVAAKRRGLANAERLTALNARLMALARSFDERSE